jgi:hypothetical protein
MPVEISIVCLVEDPGAQSKSMNTSIWVSFVWRDNFACLVAMIFVTTWSRSKTEWHENTMDEKPQKEIRRRPQDNKRKYNTKFQM